MPFDLLNHVPDRDSPLDRDRYESFDREPPVEDELRSFVEASRYEPTLQPYREPSYNVLGRTMSASEIRRLDGGDDLLKIWERNEKGRRGFAEAYTDLTWGNLPFVGDVIGITLPIRTMRKVGDTFKKLAEGEEVDAQELVHAQLYQADQERRMQMDWRGKTGEILRAMPGFAIDMKFYHWLGYGSSKATATVGWKGLLHPLRSAVLGGLKKGAVAGSVSPDPLTTAGGAVIGSGIGLLEGAIRVGLQRAASTKANAAMKTFLQSTMGKYAKGIGKGWVRGLDQGTVRASLDLPVDAIVNTALGRDPLESRAGQERYISKMMEGETDYSVRRAQAFALGDKYIEYILNSSGEMFTAALFPGKSQGSLLRHLAARVWGAKGVEKGMRAATAAGARALSDQKAKTVAGVMSGIRASLLQGGDLYKVGQELNKWGYHGWIEQILEERYGAFLRGYFGVHGDTKGFKNALKYTAWQTTDDAIAEILSYGVPTVGTLAMYGGHMKAAGITPRFHENIRTIAEAHDISADSMGAVEAYGDAGVIQDRKGVRKPGVSVQQAVEAYAELGESAENQPKGVVPRIAHAALDLFAAVTQGQIFARSGYHNLNQMMAQMGMGQGVNTYRRTVNAVRSDLESKGMPKEQATDRARELAKRKLIGLLSDVRGRLAIEEDLVGEVLSKKGFLRYGKKGQLLETLPKKERDKAVREINRDIDARLQGAAEEGRAALETERQRRIERLDLTAEQLDTKTVLDFLNEEAALPDGMVSMFTVGEQSHMFYRRGKMGPLMEYKSALARAANEVLAELPYLKASVYDVRADSETDGNALYHLPHVLRTSVSDLQALAAQPELLTSDFAYHLATQMNIDLAAKGGAEQLRKRVGWLTEVMSRGHVGSVFKSEDGTRTAVARALGNGKFVVSPTSARARSLLRQPTGFDSAAQAQEFLKAHGMTEQVSGDLVAHIVPSIFVRAEKATDLARFFSDYGTRYESEAEAAEYLRGLGAMQDSDGFWRQGAGALNNEHAIAFSADAAQFDMVQDLLENAHKLRHRATGTTLKPAGNYENTPDTRQFIDNARAYVLNNVPKGREQDHLLNLLGNNNSIEAAMHLLQMGPMRYGFDLTDNLRLAIYSKLTGVMHTIPGYENFVASEMRALGFEIGPGKIDRARMEFLLHTDLTPESKRAIIDHMESALRGETEAPPPPIPRDALTAKALNVPENPVTPEEVAIPAPEPEDPKPVEVDRDGALTLTPAQVSATDAAMDELFGHMVREPADQPRTAPETRPTGRPLDNSPANQAEPPASREAADGTAPTASMRAALEKDPTLIRGAFALLRKTSPDIAADRDRLIRRLVEVDPTLDVDFIEYAFAETIRRRDPDYVPRAFEETSGSFLGDEMDAAMEEWIPANQKEMYDHDARLEKEFAIMQSFTVTAKLAGLAPDVARRKLALAFKNDPAFTVPADADSETAWYRNAENFQKWAEGDFATDMNRTIASVIVAMGREQAVELASKMQSHVSRIHIALDSKVVGDGILRTPKEAGHSIVDSYIANVTRKAEYTLRDLESVTAVRDLVEPLRVIETESEGETKLIFDPRTLEGVDPVARVADALEALTGTRRYWRDAMLDLSTTPHMMFFLRGLRQQLNTKDMREAYESGEWTPAQARKLTNSIFGYGRTRAGDLAKKKLRPVLANLPEWQASLSVRKPEGGRIPGEDLNNAYDLSLADTPYKVFRFDGLNQYMVEEKAYGRYTVENLVDERHYDDNRLTYEMQMDIMEGSWSDAKAGKPFTRLDGSRYVMFLPPQGAKTSLYGVLVPAEQVAEAETFEQAHELMYNAVMPLVYGKAVAMSPIKMQKRTATGTSGGVRPLLHLEGGLEKEWIRPARMLVLQGDGKLAGDDKALDGAVYGLGEYDRRMRVSMLRPADSVTLKAHIQGADASGEYALVKSAIQRADAQTGFPRELIDTFGNDYDYVTDTGAFKVGEAEPVDVEFQGRSMKAWSLEIPIDNFYQTTELETPATLAPRRVPKPALVDIGTRGYQRANEYVAAMEEYLDARGLADEDISIMDPAAKLALEGGESPRSPWMNALVSMSKASAVSRLLAPEHMGIRATLLPSGGIVNAKGKPVYPYGEDKFLQPHSKDPATGKIRNPMMRVNAGRPGENGIRYGMLWTEAPHRLRNLLESHRGDPGNGRIYDALLRGFEYSDGSKPETGDGIQFFDMFKGESLESHLWREGYERSNGEPALYVPGTLGIYNRTPGGDMHAHILFNLSEPVNETRKGNLMVMDPHTQHIGGPDFDGDQGNPVQFFLYQADGSLPALPDGEVPADRKARRQWVSRMKAHYGALLMEGFRQDMEAMTLAERTPAIDKEKFDALEVPNPMEPGKWITVEQARNLLPEGSLGVVRNRGYAQRAASLSNNAIGKAVRAAATFKRMDMAGAEVSVEMALREGLETPLVLSSSRFRGTPKQYAKRLAMLHANEGDIANMILDELSAPRAGAIGFTRDLVGVYMVMARAADINKKQDLLDFTQQFIRWKETPALKLIAGWLAHEPGMNDGEIRARMLTGLDGRDAAMPEYGEAEELFALRALARKVSSLGAREDMVRRHPATVADYESALRTDPYASFSAKLHDGEKAALHLNDFAGGPELNGGERALNMYGRYAFAGTPLRSSAGRALLDRLGAYGGGKRLLSRTELTRANTAMNKMAAIEPLARLIPEGVLGEIGRQLAASDSAYRSLGTETPSLGRAVAQAIATEAWNRAEREGTNNEFLRALELEDDTRTSARARRGNREELAVPRLSSLLGNEIATELLARVHRDFDALARAFPDGLDVAIPNQPGAPVHVPPQAVGPAIALANTLQFDLDRSPASGNLYPLLSPAMRRTMSNNAVAFMDKVFQNAGIADVLTRPRKGKPPLVIDFHAPSELWRGLDGPLGQLYSEIGKSLGSAETAVPEQHLPQVAQPQVAQADPVAPAEAREFFNTLSPTEQQALRTKWDAIPDAKVRRTESLGELHDMIQKRLNTMESQETLAIEAPAVTEPSGAIPGALPDSFTATGKRGQEVRVYTDPAVGWVAQDGDTAAPITEEQAQAYYRRGVEAPESQEPLPLPVQDLFHGLEGEAGELAYEIVPDGELMAGTPKEARSMALDIVNSSGLGPRDKALVRAALKKAKNPPGWSLGASDVTASMRPVAQEQYKQLRQWGEDIFKALAEQDHRQPPQPVRVQDLVEQLPSALVSVMDRAGVAFGDRREPSMRFAVDALKDAVWNSDLEVNQKSHIGRKLAGLDIENTLTQETPEPYAHNNARSAREISGWWKNRIVGRREFRYKHKEAYTLLSKQWDPILEPFYNARTAEEGLAALGRARRRGLRHAEDVVYRSLERYARTKLPSLHRPAEQAHLALARDVPPHLERYRPVFEQTEMIFAPPRPVNDSFTDTDVTASMRSAVDATRESLNFTRDQGSAEIQRVILDNLAKFEPVVNEESGAYGRLVREWGLDGVVRPYVARKFKRDAQGDILPEGREMVLEGEEIFGRLRGTKLSESQASMGHVAHLSALAMLEYEYPGEETKADWNKALKEAVSITGLPVEAEIETLSRLMPKDLAQRLLLKRKNAEIRARNLRNQNPEHLSEAQAWDLALREQGVGASIRRRIFQGDRRYNPGRKIEYRNPATGGTEVLDLNYTAMNPVWTIPAVEVARSLDADATGYKKLLLDAGRHSDRISLPFLANDARRRLDNAREMHNELMPWLLGEGIGRLRSYAPHYFGPGYLGRDGRALMYTLDREIAAEKKAAAEHQTTMGYSKDKKGRPRRLSETTDAMLEYMFILKGLPYGSRQEAMDLLNSGQLEHMGLTGGMTYADVANEIHTEVMNELTLRKQRKEDLKAKLSKIENPLALARALREMIAGYKHREYSNRSKRRHYKTFLEAYTHAGLRPANMVGAADAVHRYVSDVMSNLKLRATLNNAVTTKDGDGSPIIVPVPNVAFEGDSVLTPGTWKDVMNSLERKYGVVADPAKTVAENVRAIVDEHVAKEDNWTRVESPYGSIAEFYAARGDTENVLDAWLAGGEAAGLLKHVVDKPWEDPYGVYEGLTRLNSWSKLMSVQMSMFFPLAGLESLTALSQGKFWREGGPVSLVEFNRMLKSDHPYTRELTRIMDKLHIARSHINNPLGLPRGVVAKDVDSLSAFVESRFGKKAGDAARSLGELPLRQTEMVFDGFFNSAKVWATHHFYRKLKSEAEKAGQPFNAVEAMKPFADYINQELGGWRWERYSWATPTWRRHLQLALFSPMWTMSAANAAGFGLFTAPVFKNWVTPEAGKHIMFHRWPSMLFYVMLMVPAAMQGIAYLAGAAAGTNEDDDEYLMFNNEEGKNLHADITPLMRTMPWYKGEPTGGRRVYIRWGKQAYETKRWIESPWNATLGKTSNVARWALEQATGTAAGNAAWPMPFKDMGLAGLVLDKYGEFGGSRLGHTVSKFAPFSLIGWAQNKDAAPLQMVGPTSKGMSFYRATKAAIGVLDSFARDKTYAKIYTNPRIKANLEALIPEILDAAARNGYDPAKVLNSARGAVLKDLYARMYRALDKGDVPEVERWGRAVARLNGTVGNALKSVRNRNSMYGKEDRMTKEERGLIRQAFNRP